MRGNSSVNGLHQTSFLAVRKWLLGCGIGIALGLSGCSSSPTYPDSGLAGDSVSLSNLALLSTASDSLKDGEFRNAALQLQLLSELNLSQSEQIDYLLLMAQLRLSQNEPEIAQGYLEQLQDIQQFASPAQERRYGLLKVNVLEAQQQFLAAARERDFLAG
ncbi:MAG: penicillin-binding protein activator, partial [Pseudomonadota bacterium]